MNNKNEKEAVTLWRILRKPRRFTKAYFYQTESAYKREVDKLNSRDTSLSYNEFFGYKLIINSSGNLEWEEIDRGKNQQ